MGLVWSQIRRQLDELPRIDPDGLAELFMLASVGDPATQRQLLCTLHSALLSRTIRHASEHVPWYRHRPEYRGWAPDDRSPPDLSSLPITSRELIAADDTQFVADDVQLCSASHTSGTTGTPLTVLRSQQEVDFLRGYFLRLFTPEPDRALRPLTMHLPNAYHGTAVPIPGIGLTLVAGVTDDLLLNDAVRSLRTSHRLNGYESRISFLSGLVHHVLLLTSYLVQQGIDPAEFKLHRVSIAGGLAPPHWRRFLAETWKCGITDRFSLTEMIGGASRCDRCDRFHLDSHLFGEVVDVDTGQAVAEGVGSLVLTGLHPFVQMQPFIRYDTGDLVYRRPSECAPTLTFDFLGRRDNAVSETRGAGRQWLYFPVPLYDTLLGIPDVRTQEWCANVRQVRDCSVGGLPYVAVVVDRADRPLRLLLRVELRYAPQFHRDRAAEIRRTVVDALINTAGSSLGRRISRGDMSVDVELVGPGTLDEPRLKV